jgi:Uma2 family endonuclease
MHCALGAAGHTLPAMSRPSPTDPAAPALWTAEQYLALVDEGQLGPDDRVELLEGVIVSMAPQNVPHAAGVFRVHHALHRAVGERALVRVQLPLVLGERSVPEPDTAVVSGQISDFDHAHPRTALLVVEVADSSLKQDRLTKRAIYAAAGIPEYWIVNLPDDCVEVRRDAEAAARRYARVTIARRGETIELGALPGVRVAVDDLLPS